MVVLLLIASPIASTTTASLAAAAAAVGGFLFYNQSPILVISVVQRNPVFVGLDSASFGVSFGGLLALGVHDGDGLVVLVVSCSFFLFAVYY